MTDVNATSKGARKGISEQKNPVHLMEREENSKVCLSLYIIFLPFHFVLTFPLEQMIGNKPTYSSLIMGANILQRSLLPLS